MANVKNAFEEALETGMHNMTQPKAKQGFASMNPALVRQIASKGGHAAKASNKKHKFTSETARAAGRKGLLARGYKV